jgi:dolichol-phosphate mannosyltransferase
MSADFQPARNMRRQEMLSVIVPTYNEKDNIVPLVSRIHQVLSGRNYEIVIVDDSSQDGTIELASNLAKQYPIKLCVRREEKGLATAVIHGIKQASGNIIGVMDADLQHPPEVLPRLLKALEDGADMVFASRYIKGGGCPNWGLSRKVISRGAMTWSHILLPSSRRVKDPMTGFFMFRRENVDPDKLKPIGYKIALEILLVGDFKNVVEVPFIFKERSAGQSKLRPQQQIDYLKHIFSLMWRTGELAMFLKFALVGLSGVGVNEGVYWLLTRFGGMAAYDYWAVVIGIEVSIITNFILNDTFTFAKHRAGKSFLGRLLKFNLICLAGAGIQWGLFMLFTRVCGVYDLLSNFIGIVIAFFWNYFVNRNWTWK